MIAIDNIILSDEIVGSCFRCDINYCKGACCEDGDAGAMIAEEEKKEIEKYYPNIKHVLTQEGLQTISKEGLFVYHDEFGWVTPTIGNGMCVFGYKNHNGQIICAYEQFFREGKIKFQKPLSCHLFPIKKSVTEDGTILLNYEPRHDICKYACICGKNENIPVYIFLKEPLIRAYGKNFYEALTHIAQNYFNEKS